VFDRQEGSRRFMAGKKNEEGEIPYGDAAIRLGTV
jgi:hypothetical protein